MKKTLSILLMLMCVSFYVSAYDFMVNGLCYKIISFSTNGNHYVAVTYQDSSSPSYYNLSGALNIPASVTYNGSTCLVTKIDELAFRDCIGLTSVTIPNSVTEIGYAAFSGCSGLTGELTIPSSVTSIGSNAFSNCTGLTSVTIPGSVTSIGYTAFSGCSGLTSLSVESSNSKYDSRGNCNAIIESETNTIIAGCKNTTIPNSVTTIGYAAFYRCSGLTSVTIPNSVTKIDSYAFLGCSGLTSLTIPNSVTTIGYYAFQGCIGLTSVTIPNSVTTISDAAFSGCSGLTSVTIPNSVTSIGSNAFSNCTGLASVIIPNSVTSIGSNAFANCIGLTSVTIPNLVTSIGSNAFSNCTGLTSVTIPGSVTSIGNNVFSGCTGLTSVEWNAKSCSDFYVSSSPFYGLTGIKSFIFGNEVERIPECLCYGLTGLNTAIIGENVTSIGEEAFKNCSFLENLVAMRKRPIIINSNVFEGIPKSSCDLHVREGSKIRYENQDVWKEFLIIIEDAEDYADVSSGSGSGIYGDVNGDGVVTAVDVTEIYNILLGD